MLIFSSSVGRANRFFGYCHTRMLEKILVHIVLVMNTLTEFPRIPPRFEQFLYLYHGRWGEAGELGMMVSKRPRLVLTAFLHLQGTWEFLTKQFE